MAKNKPPNIIKTNRLMAVYHKSRGKAMLSVDLGDFVETHPPSSKPQRHNAFPLRGGTRQGHCARADAEAASEPPAHGACRVRGARQVRGGGDYGFDTYNDMRKCYFGKLRPVA
jgi:hypothetical protein